MVEQAVLNVINGRPENFTKIIESILEPYDFTAEEYIEDNGSVTLSLNEMDLVENGKDKQEALINMGRGILEYADDFYNDFDSWAKGYRKAHIPYLLKALIINDAAKIGGLVQCHPGEN